MFELVKRLARCFCLLLALAAPSLAQERPSWAIADAVDRLIAKNALFLPGRDGFVKLSDGTLTQYELPAKNYLKEGKSWQVELLSRRWRKKEPHGWTAWHDARPQYGAWKIGVVRVDVLASGVQATWLDNQNFSGTTAPGEAEVVQRLDTLGQKSIAFPADPGGSANVDPVQPIVSSTSSPRRTYPVFQQSNQAAGGLPAGMSRPVAQVPAPSPAVPGAVQGAPRPAFTLPPGPSPTPAPRPLVSTPVPSPVRPATGPQGRGAAKDGATVALPPVMPFAGVLPYFIGAVVAMSALSMILKKSKRSPSSRRKSGPAKQPSPPPLPVAFPAPATNPLDLIQRTEHLLTPAELAFFAVLEPLVHSSHRISSKVRLADLFNAAQGPGQQTAFNKIVGKHIDFVLTDSATSRILCGIELDESSHARPDRIERDRFVNEVFARNQLPLLRVPFSWTYYPDGLRARLVQAGLAVAET